MANYDNKGNRQSDNDCLQMWKKNLISTKNALEEANAHTSLAKKEWENAAAWEYTLKSYWENVEESNKIIVAICNELKLFGKHAERVCENTECTVRSIEILFCLLVEFFSCTDKLKDYVSEIEREIECLNDQEINANSSIILRCLKDFLSKLNEATQKQHEVIKMVIDLLKQSKGIYAEICANSCSLKHILKDLEDSFCGDCDSEADHDCDDEDSCNATIEPKPKMPLEDDPYYKETRRQYEKSKEEAKKAKEKYDDRRDKSESLTACKKSLEEAIDAAEATKECK